MNWFELRNAAEVPSPALLILMDRVEGNLRRMISMAGGPARLRPHVKTHKLAELIHRQLDLGITRFKCATIAEAEMAAAAHAPDVLLAYQPVGPQIARFLSLQKHYPGTEFSAIVDDLNVVELLGAESGRLGMISRLWIDLDIGQHRTGVPPDGRAIELAKAIVRHPSLQFAGLHAYDGHIYDSDPDLRRKNCTECFGSVLRLKVELNTSGIEVPRVVAGGTPTFPFHAARADVECSPGTCVLWDAGYDAKIPDLEFQPAAVLLSRVVSKPLGDRLCLDLGHKAVASEMPHPRVILLNVPDARPVVHSEEHLVVETPAASRFSVGDLVFGVPWHICPTMALHQEVWVVKDGSASERWSLPARARRLSV